MTAQPLDAPRGFFPKAERDKLLARIDALEAELAELRERNRPNRDPETLARICHIGFTMGQGLVLLALYRHPGPCHNLQLARRAGVGTIWDKNGHHDDEAIVNALKCQIHHTRRSWAKVGGPRNPIETLYRVGYLMTPEARDWLTERMAACTPAWPLDPQIAPNPENRTTDDPGAITGNLKRGGAP